MISHRLSCLFYNFVIKQHVELSLFILGAQYSIQQIRHKSQSTTVFSYILVNNTSSCFNWSHHTAMSIFLPTILAFLVICVLKSMLLLTCNVSGFSTFSVVLITLACQSAFKRASSPKKVLALMKYLRKTVTIFRNRSGKKRRNGI